MPGMSLGSQSGGRSLLAGARHGRHRLMTMFRVPRGPGMIPANMSRTRRIGGRLLIGSALGAALMYLFDPAAGTRRRALLRDKFVHMAHMAKGTATTTIPQKADYLSGFATGAYHRAKDMMPHQEELVPDESQFITDRVMSIVFRDPKFPKGQINVNTVDQIVYLRGHIEDQSLVNEIEERTRSVHGVKDVVNLINRPDVDPSAIRNEDWHAV